MPEKKFELGDYVEVKDRLKLFYELYGKGSIVTEEVTLTSEPDGKPRVMVRAAAYRTPDDPHPGIGYSWLELPGSTPYTRGSEVENAETSAWGRAIASLGILVDRSIASAQEVQNKTQQPTGATQTAAGEPAQAQTPPGVTRAEGGLIGIASLGKSAPVDGELRTSAKPHDWKCSHGFTQAHQHGPTGDDFCDEVNVREPEDSVGFVIGEGRDKVQVVAYGPKASGLAPLLASEVIGQRVQVFGPTSDETMKVRGRDISFLRVRLERLVTPEAVFDFRDEPELPEPPDDVELLNEAPSIPLFEEVPA